MSNDIIEIKPRLGPISINIKELCRRFFRVNKRKDIAELSADRFLVLMHKHNVLPVQVQHFFPDLTPEKVKNPESLLPYLSRDVLIQAANLFNVNLSWLDGDSDTVYSTRYCYKDPEKIFQHYKSLRQTDMGFSLRAVFSEKKLDKNSRFHQPIVLILVEKVEDLGDKEIVRYHIYNDVWDWSEKACRIQLKAIIRLLYLRTGKPIPLCNIPSQDLMKIAGGILFPNEYLKRCILMTDPSFEDYCLSKHESAQSKEADELMEVLSFIERNSLSI